MSETWHNFVTHIWDQDKKGLRDVNDFSSSAWFRPTSDRIIGIFYAENQQFRKIWNRHSKDFHYQNQCDKPNDISQKQWEKRKSVWESILPLGDDIPAQNGFSFTFTSNAEIYGSPKEEEIAKYYPSEEKRLKDLYVCKAIEELNHGKEIKAENAMQIVCDAEEFVKDPKNYEKIEQWKKEIKPKLLFLNQ